MSDENIIEQILEKYKHAEKNSYSVLEYDVSNEGNKVVVEIGRLEYSVTRQVLCDSPICGVRLETKIWNWIEAW